MNNRNNELYHYGVKGMKWGVRKKKPLTPRQIRKSIEEAKKSGRLMTNNPNVWGIKRKNGDVIFVDANDVRKLGVDAAEKKTWDHVSKKWAEAEKAKARTKKGKSYVDKMLRDEEKTVVEDLMKTYDETDPDRDEAMSVLREIYKDLD